jgi:hypothetical protein
MLKKLAIGSIGIVMFAPFVSSAYDISRSCGSEECPASTVQVKIDTLLAQIKLLQAQIAQLQGQTTQTDCVDLSRTLTLGSSSSDVTDLQNYLIGKNYLDAKYNTGYYGFITAQAVGKMQLDLGLVSSSGDTAYGIMGPKTRATIECNYIVTPTPLPTPLTQVQLNVNSQVTATGNGAWMTVTIAGNQQNRNVNLWKLQISCSGGITMPDPKGAGENCGKTFQHTTANMADPTKDYVWLSAGATNDAKYSGNIVFALSAYDANGNNVGGDKEIVVLSGNVQSSEVQQVQAQDVMVGTGAQAVPGSIVSVLYVGKLSDGTTFDSTDTHGNQPLVFTLGVPGSLIAGFQIGVNGMKVGGERIITIPPTLGYGNQDVKDATGKVIIPANSTLTFDIKLTDVKSNSPSAALIYEDALNVTSCKDLSLPTIFGDASGVGAVTLVVSNQNGKQAGSDSIPVINGRWSGTVSPALPIGMYTVSVYGNDKILASGTLHLCAAASATIDQSSLTITTANRTIKGTATNVASIKYSLFNTAGVSYWNSGSLTLSNGIWSQNLSTYIADGTYKIKVYDESGATLTSGTLTVSGL